MTGPYLRCEAAYVVGPTLSFTGLLLEVSYIVLVTADHGEDTKKHEEEIDVRCSRFILYVGPVRHVWVGFQPHTARNNGGEGSRGE